MYNNYKMWQADKDNKLCIDGSLSTPIFYKWVSLYEYRFIEFGLTYKITNAD